jgi:hypothetical protein
MLRDAVTRGGVLISSHNPTSYKLRECTQAYGRAENFWRRKLWWSRMTSEVSFSQLCVCPNDIPGHRARSSCSGASPPEAPMQGPSAGSHLPSVGFISSESSLENTGAFTVLSLGQWYLALRMDPLFPLDGEGHQKRGDHPK